MQSQRRTQSSAESAGNAPLVVNWPEFATQQQFVWSQRDRDEYPSDVIVEQIERSMNDGIYKPDGLSSESTTGRNENKYPTSL